jgi:hypothetical protein
LDEDRGLYRPAEDRSIAPVEDYEATVGEKFEH